MSELGQGALQVTFKGAELSLDVMVKVFAAILRELGKMDPAVHGLQSLKSLEAQGSQLTPVDFHESDLQKVAAQLKKYQVDFSIMKNENGREHTLFFKAKDTAVIQHALRQYLDASQLGLGKEAGKTITVTMKDAEDAARSFVKGEGKAPEAGTGTARQDFGGIIEVTTKTATYSREDTNRYLDYLAGGERPLVPYAPKVKTEAVREFFYDRQEYDARIAELKSTPAHQGGIVSGKETALSVVCQETTRQEALRMEKEPGFHEYELAAGAREREELIGNADKNIFDRIEAPKNPPGKDAAAKGRSTAVQDFLKEHQKKAELFNSKLPPPGPSRSRGMDR